MTTLAEAEQPIVNHLTAKIINAINQNGGKINFSTYMNMALYDGEYGYYNNSLSKFGKDGDFITSPTSSPLFGEALSSQLKELLHHLQNKSLLEIGAGNGMLACAILAAMGKDIESYHILEQSPHLIGLQQQLIKTQLPAYYDKVIWLNSLPDNFTGIILANELLDALPCELITITNKQVMLNYVTHQEEQFKLTSEPLTTAIDNNLTLMINDLVTNSDFTIGNNCPYTTEISPNTTSYVKQLATILKSGYLILIDYGYSHNEYYSNERSCGTLRGFYKHTLVNNVLVNPGIIDITSSVNFTNVAKIAIDNGLDLLGYTTQANFLINCGILDVAAKQQHSLADADYLVMTNQLNKLTSPNFMGDVFKVICFARNQNFGDPLGFQFGDRSYTL